MAAWQLLTTLRDSSGITIHSIHYITILLTISRDLSPFVSKQGEGAAWHTIPPRILHLVLEHTAYISFKLQAFVDFVDSSHGSMHDCCQVQPEPGDAMWPVPHRTTKAQGADPSPCLPKIPGYCPRRNKDRQSIFCIPWLAVQRVWVLRFEGTLCVAEIQTKNMNPTRYVQVPPHTQICV